MTTRERGLAIGEVARRTGIKVPTIRYYEEIDLLPRPVRSEGNRRTFGPGEVQRLAFIRHARDLGFEIDAIRTLLSLREDPCQSCHEADGIARRHLADIERRIAALMALKTELQQMLDSCSQGSVGECRVLKVLGDHALCHADHDRPAVL